MSETAKRYDEAELLNKARKYSFLGRMDKAAISGPIFERGHNSVVIDTNGKEYLDFNSGQMCSALGHNHPQIVAAIKEGCDTLIMPRARSSTLRKSSWPHVSENWCRGPCRSRRFLGREAIPTRPLSPSPKSIRAATNM